MRYIRQSPIKRRRQVEIRLTGEEWPSEARIRHLELIQSIVTRLATNSFVAKGWALTVAAAIYGFAANHLNPWIASASLVPTLGFWWLDAYFLLHERLFRCLYNDAQKPTTSVELFSMNTRAYRKGENTTWPSVFLSITLIVFLNRLAAGEIARAARVASAWSVISGDERLREELARFREAADKRIAGRADVLLGNPAAFRASGLLDVLETAEPLVSRHEAIETAREAERRQAARAAQEAREKEAKRVEAEQRYQEFQRRRFGAPRPGPSGPGMG